MENKFNLSEKEIQDLQAHGFATVNGVPLSTLSFSDEWIKDQESVPWCKKCGDRPAVEPYDELLCDQCNSQVWRLFLTDDEADS